jgi:broad specificity phosphatase PhoE
MTMRVYLIRHGATELGGEDCIARGIEVELSAEGHWQTERLAERLADDKITAFYCSPLRRTLETARILASPYHLSPNVREGLREIHHGHWETILREEVEPQFSDEYRAWQEDLYTFAPLGDESGLLVMAWALPAIREIVVNHQEETVVIVSHKATIWLMISSLLGFNARDYRDRLEQSPACLNILDFKDPVSLRLMRLMMSHIMLISLHTQVDAYPNDGITNPFKNHNLCHQNSGLQRLITDWNAITFQRTSGF